MLRTLIVGLGRSGRGLHAPVLTRLRCEHRALFADHPIVGCDPRSGLALGDGVTVSSLERAADLVPADHTVVHVCTPPAGRAGVLARLAGLGFRRLIVEKPLAVDLGELAAIDALRARHRLDIVVVTHWLSSTLTHRIEEIVRSGRFGPLQSITVDQDKPRFGRSARTEGHPSAFDVEIPHSLAVALALAGPAELGDAGWTDPTGPRSRLSGAWLSMRHQDGVGTTIRSDLTSPVRRREIVVRLGAGEITGHFPVSADDHHAQLWFGAGNREVFEDEALSPFLLAGYRYFAGRSPAPPGGFALHASVVRLLARAKQLADQRSAVPAHVG
jgi:hypothetical protein